MDHVAVLLEHVDLLNGLDGLDVHLLQGGLKFLVIGASSLVDLLDLSAGSTLASASESDALVELIRTEERRRYIIIAMSGELM